MSNIITQQTYVLDEDGIISDAPIRLRYAMLFPSNVGDQAPFRSWNESNTPDTTMRGKTVTVSATDPSFTSTGNFETAEVTVGDIIRVYESSSGENLDAWLVKTRNSDNKITLDPFPTVTADTTPTYSWKIWTPWKSLWLKAEGTKDTTMVDFGDLGYEFPNLALDGLSGGAIVYLLRR